MFVIWPQVTLPGLLWKQQIKHVSSLSANNKERLLFWKGKHYTSASPYLPKSGFQPYHTAGPVKSFIQLHSLLSKENPKWEKNQKNQNMYFSGKSSFNQQRLRHIEGTYLSEMCEHVWAPLTHLCEEDYRRVKDTWRKQREAKMRAYSAPENTASFQKETCYFCFSLPQESKHVKEYSAGAAGSQQLKCQEQVCPSRTSTLS